jgi:DHA2 family multidrug resistance protein
MVRGAQVHQNYLVEHLSPLNAGYAVRVQMLEKTLTPMLGLFQAKAAALGLIYKQLMQQSQLMTYMDSFRRLAYLSFASIPLVFFFKRPKGGVHGGHVTVGHGE